MKKVGFFRVLGRDRARLLSYDVGFLAIKLTLTKRDQRQSDNLDDVVHLYLTQ